ncbi:MAG: hypothetical protein K2P78_14015 [Gemmataceae bacterium]|nr:hypothetical protein [Gemmataceae bacterium]
MFARAAAVVVLGLAAASAADPERSVAVPRSKALPKFDRVLVYEAGAVTPGKPVPKPVADGKFGEAIPLPGDGPFDVYIRPKGQLDVPVARKVTVGAGKMLTFDPAETLGTLQVFQTDDSPRLGKIVLTDPLDPGPDEKGHVPVQAGTEYREELAVPDGFYAVWVVPGNGARAQRIAERVRVLAGKNVRVGD